MCKFAVAKLFCLHWKVQQTMTEDPSIEEFKAILASLETFGSCNCCHRPFLSPGMTTVDCPVCKDDSRFVFCEGVAHAAMRAALLDGDPVPFTQEDILQWVVENMTW